MKRSGFTLIEVMVATAIFAMMAAVIAAAYVNVLRAYEKVGDLGLRDAQLVTARTQFLRTAERDRAEEGANFSDLQGRVEWKAEIEPTLVPDLFRIRWTCVLQPTGAGREEKVEEEFWLLRPNWSRPDERGPLAQKFREVLEEGMPEAWQQGGKR